jgi:peptidoglycan/xylan/chitin deacetylase (PgdA/CDA1 family)
MKSLRNVTLMCALVLAAANSAGASKTPVDPVQPTGCASGPGATFDAGITVSRQWGIVPFEVQLEAAVVAGYDPAIDVAWDFDGDSLADASGLVVEHTFTEPVDQGVTAWFSTQSHGTFTRSATISGYTALMSITFDDGQQSVYTDAFPILAARGLTATVYVVPTWMDWNWYLTWGNLHELQDSSWDIASHTLTHPNLTEVDSATLHFELSESKAVLQARGFPAKHFAVPYGACNWTVVDATRLYYESCRGWKGLNPPLDDTDPYLLKWDVTARTKPLSAYTQMIDSVASYGGWYILNNHLVYPNCYDINTCVTNQMFANILDYALQHRIKILNIDQALASRDGDALRSPPPAGPSSAGQLVLTVERSARFGLPVAISFTVPSGLGAEVGIYDVTGRRVRALAAVRAGQHTIAWEGDNDFGAPVASGVYFCVLATADGRVAARKVIVAR